MAMNYSDYPENWKEIRAEVLERAKNADGISQCECIGECGREHKGKRCPHIQYERLTTKSKYKVILTTAHLCHNPRCARRNHLKSMCQPCHQIFDLRERQKREGGNTRTRKYSGAQLSESAKCESRPPDKKNPQPKAASQPRIPYSETLLLPVLKLLADDVEHSTQEIRERFKVEFNIVPHELAQKNENGTAVFHNNVALALANLQGAPHGGPKAIVKIKKDIYRITEYGKTILSRNPSNLTIKDLRSWR